MTGIAIPDVTAWMQHPESSREIGREWWDR